MLIENNCFCWCGNCQYDVLIEGSASQNFKILRCSNCGLVRTFPVPDYSMQRYLNYGALNYVKNNKILADQMRKILKEIMKFKASGRFLEIGSSIGCLLGLAKNKNFEINGVEPSKEAVKIAEKNVGEGIIKNCSFEEANFPDNYFDVVAMNHVLEHVLDLNGMFSRIKNVLKKDGIIFIGVPNFDGAFRKITKKSWPGLRSNEHIWQFEPKIIKKILKASGFKVIKVKKTFSRNPKSIASFPEGFLPKDFLLGILNWILGLFGLGDNMYIIAIKSNE